MHALGDIFHGKTVLGPMLTLGKVAQDIEPLPDDKIRDELQRCMKDLTSASEAVDDRYLYFHERLTKRDRIAADHEPQKHDINRHLGSLTEARSCIRGYVRYIDMMRDPMKRANAVADYVYSECIAAHHMRKTTTLTRLLAGDHPRICLKFFKDMVKKFEQTKGQAREEIEHDLREKRRVIARGLKGQHNDIIAYCKGLLDAIGRFMDSFPKEPSQSKSPRVESETPQAKKHQFRHGQTGSKWWYKKSENGVNQIQNVFNGLAALESRLKARMEAVLKGEVLLQDSVTSEAAAFSQELTRLREGISSQENSYQSEGGHTIEYYAAKANAFADDIATTCNTFHHLVGKYRPLMVLHYTVLRLIRLGSEVPSDDSLFLLKKAALLASHVQPLEDKFHQRIWKCVSKNLARHIQTPLAGEEQVVKKVIEHPNAPLDEQEQLLVKQYLLRASLKNHFFQTPLDIGHKEIVRLYGRTNQEFIF